MKNIKMQQNLKNIIFFAWKSGQTALYWLINTLLISLCVGSIAYANIDEADEEAVLAALMAMDIEQLGEVIIELDDVFDVFDGLIKARKVSVATGESQDMSKAPSVTTVITAQDIEAMGARDLDEVLEAVPGLHVSRKFNFNMPIYSIRGITSDMNPEVLILVNGIPISSLYLGNRSLEWGGMPVNSIARVEVIRGPGSAVFGADAFSGVINIITKTAQDIDGTETGIRAGSFDTYESWVLHGKNYGGFDVAFMAEYQTTAGYQKTIQEDAQTQFDKLFGTNASLAPGSIDAEYDVINLRTDISRGNWQLRAGYHGVDNLGNGAGLAEALDPSSHWASDRLNADITWHNANLTRYWDATVQASYFYDDQQPTPTGDQLIFPAGAMGGAFPLGFTGNPGFKQEQIRLDLFGFYSGVKNHLLRFGTGYYYGDMYEVTESKNFGPHPDGGAILPTEIVDVTDTPFIYITEEMRKAWYVNIQDIWHINESWELTAGVRYDKYSDFGSTVNPRAALVWQATPKLTTKLLYGSAFRAPSFVDTYNVNNPVVIGNPDIKPETIETWELAFNYLLKKNLYASINFFHYDIEDKIQLDSNAGTDVPITANIGEQTGDGMELELRWKPTVRSSLLFNYAFQKSTDKLNDADVGNAPTHQVYLRGDYLLAPNWFLDTRINWVADRKRPFGDPREELDDYTTVDMTLRYKDIKGKKWNMAIGVRNLFDADAREPSPGPDANGIINIPYDLPMAGRSLFAELRYKF
ncbi:MAG: TonB-dependent receptor [Pseudomonadota bacterium]